MPTDLFTRALRLAVLAGAVALGGCANLAAIQEFGNMSAEGAAYTRLTDAHVNSFDVMKTYTLEKDSEGREELARLAAARKPQGAQLALYHKAVADYMASLADLAGDTTTFFDPELKAMSEAATKAGYMDEAKAGYVKALSQVIVEAAASAYQQRQLKQVIEGANAPLQAVLADMVRQMDAFQVSLDNERARFYIYHRSLLATARENNREPVAAQLVWAEGQLILRDYDARAAAIPKYLETLKKIGAAHQALYDNRDKIGDKEIQAQIKRYTRQIRAAYSAARAAGQ